MGHKGRQYYICSERIKVVKTEINVIKENAFFKMVCVFLSRSSPTRCRVRVFILGGIALVCMGARRGVDDITPSILA